MEFQRKYNVADDIYIPIIKAGEVNFAVGADWTPAAGDVKVSKDGAAAVNIGTLPVAIVMGNGAMWKFVFTGTELSAKLIMVTVIDASTKAVEDTMFDIITYGNASAQLVIDFADVMRGTDGVDTATMRGTDSAALASEVTAARMSELDAGTGGKMANQVDVIQQDTTTDIPALLPSALIGGRMNSTTENMAANVLTAAAINTAALNGKGDWSLASVVGALADAAAADDPTSADTLMQYIKQLINVLVGSVGIGTWPAEQPPGNAINLFEVIRAMHVDSAGLNGDAMRGTDGVDTATMRGIDSALLASSAPTNFGDLAITPTTGRIDVGEWLGAAVNALLSGRVDSRPGALGANVITAASINAAAFLAAKFGADFITDLSLSPAACQQIAAHIKRITVANIELDGSADAIVNGTPSAYSEVVCNNLQYDVVGTDIVYKKNDGTIIGKRPFTVNANTQIITLGKLVAG